MNVYSTDPLFLSLRLHLQPSARSNINIDINREDWKGEIDIQLLSLFVDEYNC